MCKYLWHNPYTFRLNNQKTTIDIEKKIMTHSSCSNINWMYKSEINFNRI